MQLTCWAISSSGAGLDILLCAEKSASNLELMLWTGEADVNEV
jgi:hypothetical protein